MSAGDLKGDLKRRCAKEMQVEVMECRTGSLKHAHDVLILEM